MPEYNIQRIGAENFNVLIPLMKDCFGMDVNIDYFRWKYLENPAGNFIGFIAVEKSTGEIGAYYGVIPQCFYIDGTERIIYQSCDTMTHSRHRRRGLFQKLALHCYDYIRTNHFFFIIGFGGGQSTPGFLKFGWKSVFNFRYYFKPNFFCRFHLPNGYPDSAFCHNEALENIEGLINEGTADQIIHAKRTLSHLKWRIANPLYRYQVVSFTNKGKVSGYVIYYLHQNKLFLFDFVLTDKKSRHALLWYLSDIVKKNRYKGIVAFCQEKGLQSRQLMKSFFITNPIKRGPLHEVTPFIFFSDASSLTKYSSAESWCITSFDHDSL
jgi:hypothetical protein